MGEAVERLEPFSAEYTSTRFAVGYGSRTDALFLALPPVGVQRATRYSQRHTACLATSAGFRAPVPCCCCRCPAGRGGSTVPRRERRSLSTRAGPSPSARGRSRSIGAPAAWGYENTMSSKDEAASQKNRPCVSTDALRSTITNRRHWFPSHSGRQAEVPIPGRVGMIAGTGVQNIIAGDSKENPSRSYGPAQANWIFPVGAVRIAVDRTKNVAPEEPCWQGGLLIRGHSTCGCTLGDLGIWLNFRKNARALRETLARPVRSKPSGEDIERPSAFSSVRVDLRFAKMRRAPSRRFRPGALSSAVRAADS